VKVDRLVARVVWMVANDAIAPRWNAQNEKTARFRVASAVGRAE
jgi:hypothetical protein